MGGRHYIGSGNAKGIRNLSQELTQGVSRARIVTQRCIEPGSLDSIHRSLKKQHQPNAPSQNVLRRYVGSRLRNVRRYLAGAEQAARIVP
jgi:hypothetical protein